MRRERVAALSLGLFIFGICVCVGFAFVAAVLTALR